MLVHNFGNPHIQQEMQLLILVPTHLPKFNNHTYWNTRLNWKWQIGLIKSNNPHKKANNLYVDIITRQIWGIWKLRPAYSPETPNLGQNRWCFVPCDLEIWWITLENNRAPLLCCFKLCATFHSHRWIQTGVAVRKRPIWVKFDDF